MSERKLRPGYAETSSKPNPTQPEQVMVTAAECEQAVCQGEFDHPTGWRGWLRFKIRNQKRYYFQLQTV
jgi:hypothetical protein